nr:hypothetical protein [Pandoravirus massiliensis]
MASSTKGDPDVSARCALPDCGHKHTEPLLTKSVVDVGARVAVFVDERATLTDFVQHIYPERIYNEAVDWDRPDQPYNHMYARYTRCGKRDAASMAFNTIESARRDAMLMRCDATGRFVAWYRRAAASLDSTKADVQALDALLASENGAARLASAWVFLDRLSSDIGFAQCIELTGTREEGADAFARFDASNRVGSRFWLGCDDRLKAALFAWRGIPHVSLRCAVFTGATL